MNKQEAIKRVEQMGEFERFVDEQVSKKSVLDIISLIDEPQKVVVPKFVCEWIKPYRHSHTLLRVLNAVENKQVTPSAVNDWILDNQYDFIKAWIDGYEIEQEKLYTVEIPDPHGIYKTRYLFRNSDGNIRIGGSDCRDIFLTVETHLTESEIRKDFEFAWKLAKEVE